MSNYDRQESAEWLPFMAELQQKERVLLEKKAGGALHPDEEIQLEEIRAVLSSPALKEVALSVNPDEAWLEISNRMQPAKTVRLRPIRRYIAYAAAVALLIGLGWFAWQQNTVPDTHPPVAEKDASGRNKATLILEDGIAVALNGGTQQKMNDGTVVSSDSAREINYLAGNGRSNISHTLKVPRGGSYKLELADGTGVWVNAETTLRYPTSFENAASREVHLISGEAYFDVAENAGQPFIVHSNNIDVKVLGTAFNISAYDKNVSTTLVTGKVLVRTENGSEVYLTPGQQANYNAGNESLSKTNVDVTRFVAWKDGLFVFHEATLADMMIVMGRWYDYDVVFTSAALKTLHFTGNLEKYNSIHEFLEIIQQTTDVRFTVSNRTVTVSRK